jgi:hypothetical protein
MKCSATTVSGRSCRAYAIKNSSPPLCAAHSGHTGAPKGNQNAVKHGYYRQSAGPEELRALFDEAGNVDLDQEAMLLRVYIRRLTSYLNDPELPFEQFRAAGPLLVSAIRALGYLKKQLPPKDQVDWDELLDFVGKDLGWDL